MIQSVQERNRDYEGCAKLFSWNIPFRDEFPTTEAVNYVFRMKTLLNYEFTGWSCIFLLLLPILPRKILFFKETIY